MAVIFRLFSVRGKKLELKVDLVSECQHQHLKKHFQIFFSEGGLLIRQETGRDLPPITCTLEC